MKNIVKSDINRIVFISDIHLGVRNASYEWIENTTSYFDNFFIPLLKKYKDSGDNVAVIIAGDYFDNRQHIDINIMNVAMDIMENLAQEVEVYVSIGNHDIYKKKNTNITSLRLFKSMKNVKLIKELTTLTIANDTKIMIVPWVGDPKEETEILLKNRESANYFVLHSDISGLIYDNGRQIVNGVNAGAIDNIKIYSGHIHKRQANEKVTYIGSPYQIKRSDIGNSKGVYSLKVSKSGVNEEFVDNNYSPKFLKIQLEDILNYTIPDIEKIVYNNYVDIIIKRKCKDDINIAKLMEVMDLCKPKKIEIILDKLDTEISTDQEYTASDMSIDDAFAFRLKKMNLSDEAIEALKKMNNTFMSLAIEQMGIIDE